MSRFKLILFMVISMTLIMGCNDQGEAKRAIKIDEQGKRTALVIGNGDYPSAPLENPVNDARDMAAKLERLGFKVIKKLDADQRTMLGAVDRFYKRLQKARVGL